MRPGREIDIKIAQDIFGYEVFEKDEILIERSETDESSLKPYSQDMTWAWLVAEKMRISLVAIEGGHWFAFAASNDGWPSPDVFLEYLKKGEFDLCGAAVNTNAAEAICSAALVARQKQQIKAAEDELKRISPISENTTIN